MLRRVWMKADAKTMWKPKVEEYIYSDGSIWYSFRDSNGRPHNVENFDEAQKIIAQYHMIDITDRVYNSGWIHPDIYRDVVKQRDAERKES